MLDEHPVDPGIFAFAVAWTVGFAAIACALVIRAGRRQRPVVRAAYAVGCMCLIAVVVTFGTSFGMSAWYGGTPDRTASNDAQHYVRFKTRLTPVGKTEFERLEWMKGYRRWIAWPIVGGVLSFAAAWTLRREGDPVGETAAR
jgi:hypothetical protein